MSKVKITPVLCAAAGAVLGFYVLAVQYRSGFFGVYALLAFAAIPCAVLCFFRVAASLPWEGGVFRTASQYSTAFAVGLAIGIGAGTAAIPFSAQAGAPRFGIPDSSLQAISGVLLEDPRIVSGGRAMAALSLREASGEIPGSSGRVRVSAAGEITVFFPEESAGRLREFGRGTLVFAEGTLRQTQRQAGIGSSPYLFSAESLHIVQLAPPLERFRTGVRLGIAQRFGRHGSGSGDWGGLALALLIGIRDNLDSGLAALYRNAGCAYMLALSGMHLAVLAGLLSFLLKKPLGLRASTVLGGLVIILYCFIVGPLPSLNRAALMYLLGVLAVLGMLKRESLSLLAMAFLIQIIATPQSGFSLAFMLSYLALVGILVSGESLALVFRGTVPPVLLRSLTTSLGAFLATAGISVWFFGILYPVGILTGLVLAPLITVFMLGSFLWLALDLISPVLSGLASPLLSLLYGLMEKTVSLSAWVPGIRANPRLVIWLSLLAFVGIELWGHYVYVHRKRVGNFG